MTTTFESLVAAEDAAPVEKPASAPIPRTARGIFELVLRGDPELDDRLLDERELPDNIRKLLAISIVGMAAHGAVVGLVNLAFLPSTVTPTALLYTPITLVGGFLTALVVCLPSFYFYTQLSGLDAPFRLVAAQAVRVMATTSVLLLGLLPFYAAFALSHTVGLIEEPRYVLFIGWLAPFVVGLCGIRTLLRAFRHLSGTIAITHARRGNFLLRMVLCWGAVFVMVAPIACYRIGAALFGLDL
jgi:hypothetical protein